MVCTGKRKKSTKRLRPTWNDYRIDRDTELRSICTYPTKTRFAQPTVIARGINRRDQKSEWTRRAVIIERFTPNEWGRKTFTSRIRRDVLKSNRPVQMRTCRWSPIGKRFRVVMKRTKTHDGREFKWKRLFDGNRNGCFENDFSFIHEHASRALRIIRGGFCGPHSIFVVLRRKKVRDERTVFELRF